MTKGLLIKINHRTRCTLVTSVNSSALAAIREVLKKVLKKCTDNKNGLFFAKIEEYIHGK